MGSTPLTLHGRASSSGRIHPVVLGQPIGTLWSNIRARPSARSPPCRPDASVSPLQVPAAAPSVRGGHTPETRAASSDMPAHHPACMRSRCDAPVALLPPRAPVPPNTVAFDHGIYPFDFAWTGFEEWTYPPSCVRSAHRNTLEQHPGQTDGKIPSV